MPTNTHAVGTRIGYVRVSNVAQTLDQQQTALESAGVTKMFSDALKSDRAPLVSYYGAIAGLQELGPEVIKVFILPHISSLAQKIDIGMPSATVIPYFSSVLEGLWIRIHFFADPGFGSSPFFC